MSKKRSESVLIVDDDQDILLTARLVLKQIFSNIQTEHDPHQIERRLSEEVFDLVLLDMNFTAGFTSGKEGLRWLKKIRKASPSTKVVLMTAYGDIGLAVKAIKEGASDFVVKPWDNDNLHATLISVLQESALPPGNVTESNLKQASSTSIIGASPPMQKVFDTIQKVGKTDANVLVLGENGTGKELAARALHEASSRASRAFVHVDLGAISETLFESELFGHVKGAFTDAREDREGRFEAANGGTLFLDEIGNLSLPLQAKLLSVLQGRTIQRVGSNKTIPVDIRLICATNMPLHQMVAEQHFRQDLLYRINTVEITLPPLRDRQDDILLLINHFMHVYADRYNRDPLGIPSPMLEQMKRYPWPGNIRELQHGIERAVIMEDLDSLIPDAALREIEPFSQLEDYNLEEVEREAIKKAIAKHSGNISHAAKELGLGRTTLYRKMNKYGL
ncbi:MAG: sigma-54 dependent transcriptional regulator [Bacteroidia bacterium]|nr:sigma-54 dependent transcriptional regulator [Bacteroidia bacterium]